MQKVSPPASPDASVTALTGWQHRVEPATVRVLTTEAVRLNETLGDPTMAAKTGRR